MRFTAIAGLFLFSAIFMQSNSTAHAEIENQKLALGQIEVVDALNDEIVLDELIEDEKIEVKQPVEHVVVSGDSLDKIAKTYATTWQRLYFKNTNVANPNSISVNQKIVIPASDEILTERPLPVLEEVKAEPKKPANAQNSKPAQKSASRGSSVGNTYTAGYCTYYAKQRRPDLPNNLGNAMTWVARARAQGIPTGSEPRAGAIGQKGNHVVYVEKVNGNGTIIISEMNWGGLWKITTRTVPANSHTYIY